MKMNSSIYCDIRRIIKIIVYIVVPALFFLVCQGLLNLLFNALLGPSLPGDEIPAIGSCVFLPVVVYLYGRRLRRNLSQNYMNPALIGSMAVAGSTLVLLYLLLAQKRDVGFFLRFLGFGIAGPIIEETIYRGFVYFRSQIYMQDWQSIFFSAILFAVGHHSIETMALAFLAGVLLSVVLRQTKTLLSPIILHIIWNLIHLLP